MIENIKIPGRIKYMSFVVRNITIAIDCSELHDSSPQTNSQTRARLCKLKKPKIKAETSEKSKNIDILMLRSWVDLSLGFV